MAPTSIVTSSEAVAFIAEVSSPAAAEPRASQVASWLRIPAVPEFTGWRPVAAATFFRQPRYGWYESVLSDCLDSIQSRQTPVTLAGLPQLQTRFQAYCNVKLGSRSAKGQGARMATGPNQPAPLPSNPPSPPAEIYAVFSGAIDQGSVSSIFRGTTAVIQNSSNSSIHMLMQSLGGGVSEGVCLYNFFRTLPIDLTLYNSGSVSSAAVIAFLGAKKRKVSAHATFMIHRTYSSPQFANASRLQSAANSAIIDDQRTEAILRENLNLSPEQWEIHKVTELWLTANDAVACGLAHEIAEFSPPIGSPLYNIPAT
jgi:ATP-dependent Clp protease, protease subunit